MTLILEPSERLARRCSAAGAPAGEQYVVKVVALRKYEDRAMVARERRALELLCGAARVVQLRRAYLGACHAHLVFECAPALVHLGKGWLKACLRVDSACLKL